jgi:putative Ca2+/H+ antiporter (TMEM165/GDT1 family)
MFAKAFSTAFGLTFIAELGDKTQIAVLTLSARYGFLPVFAGAVAAFIVLNALAVTVGALLARVIPVAVVRYVSAGVFILFGLLSFRPEKEREEEAEEEEIRRLRTRNPFLTTVGVIALMELGDKTQLSLVAMTSRFEAPIAVFLGGTLALALASLIGALVGKWLSRFIPEKYLRWASGAVFIVFGVLIATGVL